MDINFKGDLNGLSDQQLEFVRRKLKENNINGDDVTVEVFGEAGDNFASGMRVITVKNKNEECRIITKITQNISREVNEINIISEIMFTNEVTMYNEVLPKMLEMQKNTAIETSDMFKVPICYGASNVTPYEVILLEDLKKKNYVMLDKFKPLPSDTIKLILRTLAQYHSLSFVLKENSPVEYVEYNKKLKNMATCQHFVQNAEAFKVIGPQLSQLFDDKMIKNIIIDTINDQIYGLLELEEADKGSKYSVIVHGDCWTNNFLFQIQDDKPTECILIDYQLVRESSPAVDLHHLILNCTDYDTRSKYFQEWIDYYHSQLEERLSDHGLKINTTYPKDKLESDLKRYAKSGLGMAIFANSLMVRSNEEIAKVKEIMIESGSMANMSDNFIASDLQISSVSKIKERIEGIINTCIDLGYLNKEDFM